MPVEVQDLIARFLQESLAGHHKTLHLTMQEVQRMFVSDKGILFCSSNKHLGGKSCVMVYDYGHARNDDIVDWDGRHLVVLLDGKNSSADGLVVKDAKTGQSLIKLLANQKFAVEDVHAWPPRELLLV